MEIVLIQLRVNLDLEIVLIQLSILIDNKNDYCYLFDKAMTNSWEDIAECRPVQFGRRW